MDSSAFQQVSHRRAAPSSFACLTRTMAVSSRALSRAFATDLWRRSASALSDFWNATVSLYCISQPLIAASASSNFCWPARSSTFRTSAFQEVSASLSISRRRALTISSLSEASSSRFRA